MSSLTYNIFYKFSIIIHDEIQFNHFDMFVNNNYGGIFIIMLSNDTYFINKAITNVKINLLSNS